MPIEPFSRPLIFVAHPDDETIACGGLLQRVPASLVVFATDGAPPGNGIEREFGTLKAYSDLRFQEAARALSHIPSSSFKRLAKPDGSYFVDQHLFEELPDAATSFRTITQSFGPDAIISHAYEGGHLDHDACSFLAMHVAISLSLKRFEFPLYWVDPSGKTILQQFHDIHPSVVADVVEGDGATATKWQLSETEVLLKNEMLAEYRTQPQLASRFPASTERIRAAATSPVDFSIARCLDYSYRNRRRRLRDYFDRTQRRRLRAEALLKKFAEFQASPGND